MRSRAPFDSHESTFDFSAFVASNRGISSDEAQQLIEEWLQEYEPRAPLHTRLQELGRAHEASPAH